MAIVDLKTLSYHEYSGQPLEWSLDDLTLGQINLVVGKNSTGKTRVLNVIAGLAKTLTRDRVTIAHGNYVATFSVDGTQELKYVLRIDDSRVLEERVFLDGQEKLVRDANTLKLHYDELGQFVSHEPEPNEVSAAARKDKLQHPYLLLLDDWARAVRHYKFGGTLGQNTIGIGVKGLDEKSMPDIDDSDPDRVVGIFMKGRKDFGDAFAREILNDMKKLDYPLTEVSTGSPDNVRVVVPGSESPLPLSGNVTAIGVREDGIYGTIYQGQLSQGMFRALSVLIQVNYSQISKRAHCIIVDDIGEGLDFERSSQLIEVLRDKAKRSNFQLIMSTNDRFVMNHVPLDEWSILQRRGNKVTVRNIHNSREAFEDFRFVGMSNFAFFEMDFVNGAPREDRNLVLEGMDEHE